jgi:hypothetical protein
MAAAAMTAPLERGRGLVEVVDALGPGLEFDQDPLSRERVARRARARGPWLGLDRAVVVESDDGSGRGVRALVGVPVSTFAGCRIEVGWTGAVCDDRGPILVGRVDGVADPSPVVVRVVSGLRDAPWHGREDATRIALEGRQRHRMRRATDRVIGGRAWEMPAGSLEQSRFASAHARPEYSLRRLPARFLRGLERLLDPDERLLYAIERQPVARSGVFDRLRRRVDRRAALLILTDRQIGWLIDHADPDRYLSDWGVDVEVIPVEALAGVEVRRRSPVVELRIRSAHGTTLAVLPEEYQAESRVAAALAQRFIPVAGMTALRRRYPVAAQEPGWSRIEAFGQVEAARALMARCPEAPLASLFSPRRPGQREPGLWALMRDEMLFVNARNTIRQSLASVHSVRLALSPLSGRIEIVGEPGGVLAFPAPLADDAADLVRATRRLMGNRAS